MGFYFFGGSIEKKTSGWVAIACGFLTEDDPESVADPADLLVQVLGPHASSGKEPNEESHEADQFRSENAHYQNHRVTECQDGVDRPENEVEDACEAIWRGNELCDTVAY